MFQIILIFRIFAYYSVLFLYEKVCLVKQSYWNLEIAKYVIYMTPLHKKATIHQANTMLTTSKNVLPGG